MFAWRKAFFVPVLLSVSATSQPGLAAGYQVAGYQAAGYQAAGYRAAVEQEGRRGGIFAGATLRLALDGRKSVKPLARLKISPTSSASASSGAIALPAASGVEFGLSRAGKPELSFAGRSLASLKRQLNLQGDSTPWVVGGLALAALAVVLVTAEDDDTERPGFVCPPDPPERCRS